MDFRQRKAVNCNKIKEDEVLLRILEEQELEVR